MRANRQQSFDAFRNRFLNEECLSCGQARRLHDPEIDGNGKEVWLHTKNGCPRFVDELDDYPDDYSAAIDRAYEESKQ